MSSPASRPHSPYFIGPWADHAAIGAVSILVFAFLTLSKGALAVDQAVQALAIWVGFLGNAPHFAATSYRLYHSSENTRQYPYTAWLIPLVVAAGVTSALVFPTRIAPYFIKLYILWSPYHYSGQSLGISLLYARRSGVELGRWQRWALAAFIYGTFLSSTAAVESQTLKLTYFSVPYPTLGLPSQAVFFTQAVMWGGGLLFLAWALSWSKENGRRFPTIVLLPAAAQYLWFVVGSGFSTFFLLVPFFHGIQYLLIAWAMQIAERRRLGAGAQSPAWVQRETWRWAVINIAGGLGLFWLLPKAIAPLTTQSPFFVLAVVVAGVQIHHFFVDGVIWKLRNPSVGGALFGGASGGVLARSGRAAA